jgi:hypothetical protein
MAHRISEPQEFKITERKRIQLKTKKCLTELSLMFTVQNHSYREDGLIVLYEGDVALTVPIDIGNRPNKIMLASFLLDEPLLTNKIYEYVDVIYYKGISNGIWTLIFLEDPSEPGNGFIKQGMFYPSVPNKNKVTFDTSKIIKGLVCQISFLDVFLGKTLNVELEITSHAKTHKWKTSIELSNTPLNFRFPTTMLGLNVRVNSISFYIDTNGLNYAPDDFIMITFQEAY